MPRRSSLIALAAGAIVFLGAPAAAQGPAPKASASTSAEQAYAVPPQPLTAALASFARISGVDILYENSLGAGRISAPVDGRMTPQAALRALLAGTGLAARFTESKAAIVYLAAGPTPRAAVEAAGVPGLQLDMAEVRAPVMIGSPDLTGYQRYARSALVDIRAILNTDPALRSRAFSLRLALTISVDGRINRVGLLQGSGDGDRDRHIRSILTGRLLQPPPAGLQEALYFEVNSDRPRARG